MSKIGDFSMVSRRDALARLGSGFGMLALSSMLAEASDESGDSPLSPKPPHFQPKVKRVIFLVMNGGMSQVDTFDPKPSLDRYHGQPMPGGNLKTERKTGSLMRSPFEFKQYGQSGIRISEIFPGIGSCIDKVCLIRSMHTDIPNHEPSLTMLNCGENLMSRPSLGSWLTFGLGTENRNLPGFVVLCPGSPVVGSPLWNSSFLPAVYQGTYIPNNESAPEKLIQYIRSKTYSSGQQQRQLGLLATLNREHLAARPNDAQLEASIESMQTAFRMQSEAPEAFDIGRENVTTRDRYGDTNFGHGCLMALRLVERGVRMVQVYFGNGQPWDNHDDILIHRKLAHEADAPVAALLEDLQARGLFEETLVLFGSEFGRTPTVETSSRVSVQNGRDHNPYGFSMWLAGGGVKGGITYGNTDEFGFKAVENPVHIHDLHATILHLLGLDHTRLTYRYSGRDFRLTDVHGRVLREILS
jgi:hypothetical protein